MRKLISAIIQKSTRSVYIALVSCLCLSSVSAQQYVIADKDNTHPEISLQASLPALISRLDVQQSNDYIEVSWVALREQDTRKYIVEYSTNGTDYQSVGEVIVNKGNYTFKYHLTNTLPSMYRIKMELLNGKSFYSARTSVNGIDILPVNINPTVVHGNTINANAARPVERIAIFSGSGQQVYAKDSNGQRDYMTIVVPSLGKGIYWMTFYGDGWKSTSKFVVP